MELGEGIIEIDLIFFSYNQAHLQRGPLAGTKVRDSSKSSHYSNDVALDSAAMHQVSHQPGARG